MREMKDSGVEWIGEIPENWSVSKIKYLLDNSEFGIKCGPFGSALTGKVVDNGEIVIYGQWNIVNGDFTIRRNTLKESEYEALQSYQVQADDVLVSMMGTIGKCAIVPLDIERGVMDSHVIKIRLNVDKVEPTFFQYEYDKDNCNVIFEYFNRKKKGFIMDGLNTSIIKNAIFVLPPIECQTKIVDCLNKKSAQVDTLISNVQSQIEKLKAYKQSLITEVVTKGLDPTVPMKDSGVEWIGDIPESWNVSRIKYLCEFNPSSKKKFSQTDIVSYAPMDCIRAGNFEHKEIVVSDVSSGLTYFEENDILMAKVTPCFENGNIVIADNLTNGMGFGSSELFVFRTTKAIRKWLFYFLQNDIFKKYAAATMTGTGGLKRVSPPFVNNYSLAVPPVSDMEKMASYLDEKCAQIDRLIAIKQQKIEKLTQYKKSLIYEYVTGKREVM